jgi:hypothetical protein
MACRLWVNIMGMSVNARPYLLYQKVLCLVDLNEQTCPSIESGPSRVCSCRFPWRPVTPIYNMENMGPQGNESVSPIPDEKFWRLNNNNNNTVFTILRNFIYSLSDAFCMSLMPRSFPSWSEFPGNLDHPPPHKFRMTDGLLYKHYTFTFFRRLASSSDCDTILGS